MPLNKKNHTINFNGILNRLELVYVSAFIKHGHFKCSLFLRIFTFVYSYIKSSIPG